MFLKPTAAGARLDRCPESAVKSSGSWCRVSARTDCDGTTVNLHAGGGTVPEFLPFYFLFFLFGFYWLEVSARSRPRFQVSGFGGPEVSCFRLKSANPSTPPPGPSGCPRARAGRIKPSGDEAAGSPRSQESSGRARILARDAACRACAR